MVIGGGTEGLQLVNLLHEIPFIHVIAVVDADEQAPAIMRAAALNMQTGKDWHLFLTDEVQMIFDVTRDLTVGRKLLDVKSEKTILISGAGADLFVRLLEEHHVYSEGLHTGVVDQRMIFDSTYEEMIGVGEQVYRSVNHDGPEIRQLKGEIEEAKRIIRALESMYTFADIHGQSNEIQLAIAQAKLAASNDIPVLLRGEKGTGKALFAHAIHSTSTRSQHKFIRFNCATRHAVRLKELFGNENSKQTQISIFEEANNGTLFLDEIADLPMDLQQELLHYLNTDTIYSASHETNVLLNVKIVTATSKNLERAMADGVFLEDLYYALSRIAIQVLPLRLRKNDIVSIAEHLVIKLNKEFGMEISHLSEEAQHWLVQNEWSGNIHELENVLSRAMIYMDRGDVVITLKDLLRSQSLVPNEQQVLGGTNTLSSLMDDYEKVILETAFQSHDGNKSVIANQLGISLRSLYYKLEKFNILD